MKVFQIDEGGESFLYVAESEDQVRKYHVAQSDGAITDEDIDEVKEVPMDRDFSTDEANETIGEYLSKRPELAVKAPWCFAATVY